MGIDEPHPSPERSSSTRLSMSGCARYKGQSFIIPPPEERGSRFLQNTGTLVPGCVVSQDHNINYSENLRVLHLFFCVTQSIT
jgi:hypothetical protein